MIQKGLKISFVFGKILVVNRNLGYSCFMIKIKLFLIIFFLPMAIPCYAFVAEKNQNNPNDLSRNGITQAELNLLIGTKTETVSKEELSQWLRVLPKLHLEASQVSEAENTKFCPFDYYWCDIFLTSRKRLKVANQGQLFTNNDKIRSYLEDLARRVDKDPVEAKFHVEDGKVSAFEMAENGLKLDVDKSQEIIAKELAGIGLFSEKMEIVLAYDSPEPRIKSKDVDSMGIETLIGEGRSNFRGSPKNRLFNIKVATSRFSGILIKPEEEFSFVKVLGEVDGEHGYLPELVIKQDKTEPEFGGGICQVSTTAFRAAIYSGLKITARRNHAYPVRYYNPQGLDATVYVPRPDLRFINNTPGYILIQTKIEGTELVFDFYGSSDGRSVDVEGPKVLEYNPDGSMKTTFTQIVKDKENNVLISDIFKSSYDSPSKYPHPGEEKLTKKPGDWSDREWKEYKKANGI
jgi:vancomycin resistance protein YoaR